MCSQKTRLFPNNHSFLNLLREKSWNKQIAFFRIWKLDSHLEYTMNFVWTTVCHQLLSSQKTVLKTLYFWSEHCDGNDQSSSHPKEVQDQILN